MAPLSVLSGAPDRWHVIPVILIDDRFLLFSGLCSSPGRKIDHTDSWPGYRDSEYRLSYVRNAEQHCLAELSWHSSNESMTPYPECANLPSWARFQRNGTFPSLVQRWQPLCISFFHCPILSASSPYPLARAWCTDSRTHSGCMG